MKKPKAAQEDIDEKLAKYGALTKAALEKAKPFKALSEKERQMAANLLEMAKSYFSDAQHFESNGLNLTALAAYSYAHAWIDAGVRLGLLDGMGDGRLFVLP